MRRIGRVAVILGAALLGLLLSYSVASTLGSSRVDRVEPIELDRLADRIVPSTPTDTAPNGAIVVPPPTLAPPGPASADDDETDDDVENEGEDDEGDDDG